MLGLFVELLLMQVSLSFALGFALRIQLYSAIAILQVRVRL